MAVLLSKFTSCKQATAKSIPKKNNTLGTSVFVIALTTENFPFSKLSFRLCSISVITHIIPKPNKIPINGGKYVTVLNTGTKTKIDNPKKNITFLSNGVVPIKWSLCFFSGAITGRTPKRKLMTNNGTNKLTRLGKNNPFMIPNAEI